MFELYNESARRTLFFARYEASTFGSRAIEPFHLLLGVMRGADAVTRDLLREVADPLDDLRTEITGHVITGPPIETSVEIPFSAACKRVLTFALEESKALSHHHIGPEHLLLGILRGEDSTAAAILFGRGMRIENVRARVR